MRSNITAVGKSRLKALFESRFNRRVDALGVNSLSLRDVLKCLKLDAIITRSQTVNRCLFVAHTFPTDCRCRNLSHFKRFMHHLPSFGWEGMIVAMEEDAVSLAIRLTIHCATGFRLARSFERVGVWRPLDRFVEWLKHFSRSAKNRPGGMGSRRFTVTSTLSHLASDEESQSHRRTLRVSSRTFCGVSGTFFFLLQITVLIGSAQRYWLVVVSCDVIARKSLSLRGHPIAHIWPV